MHLLHRKSAKSENKTHLRVFQSIKMKDNLLQKTLVFAIIHYDFGGIYGVVIW